MTPAFSFLVTIRYYGKIGWGRTPESFIITLWYVRFSFIKNDLMEAALDLVEDFVKGALFDRKDVSAIIRATVDGINDFIESDNVVIRDTVTELPIENASNYIKPGKNNLTPYIKRRLIEQGLEVIVVDEEQAD